MDAMGSRFVRPYMPRQHAEFFGGLSCVFVGHAAVGGNVWASLLCGPAGFADAVDPKTLHLNAVDQSFGNCPQYIHKRSQIGSAAAMPETPPVAVAAFGPKELKLIRNADCFFVASAYDGGDVSSARTGADASHRGGPKGFVKCDGRTLTIPDYSGNNFYNTLGNLLLNPRAGLLFVDFESGEVLTLTGTVEVLWGVAGEAAGTAETERAWRFTLDRGLWLASPLRWPDLPQKKRDDWRPYAVARVVEEAAGIKSLYLEPKDGQTPTFLPGQFLTINCSASDDAKRVRTYTLSSAPGECARISVKLEGVASTFLHGLAIGDVLICLPPRGAFTFDAHAPRAAVLLAGGIGVTPMISMLRALAQMPNGRSCTLLHSCRERAFAEECKALSLAHSNIRVFAVATRDAAAPRLDAAAPQKRIDAAMLQAHGFSTDAEYFVCGPPTFAQAMYDYLIDAGVADSSIRSEAFGPASLRRHAAVAVEEKAPAEKCRVRLAITGKEVEWESKETLLELLERIGLNPDSGCRSGSCGTCAAHCIGGEVTYKGRLNSKPLVDDGIVLLCQAVPATETLTLAL
ncbi:hypothetical protein M885DRAFT_589087 [Pelagophyceae sp. CCMP2097]|nr:hypothetical protein M885DRAFT_589087 [Pelagophyceae sp. CCMP2097]